MKTHIETNRIIASYEDSVDLRNKIFEAVIELFTLDNFNAYNIVKNGNSENFISELEDILDFDISYKEPYD